MKNFGFIRVAAAVPQVRVADTTYNTEEICRLIGEAHRSEVSLLTFPELSVTGSTCGDLFLHRVLLEEAEEGIRKIAKFSKGKDTVIITGAPVQYKGRLYDCAVVIKDGDIKGLVPKVSGRGVFASGRDLVSCEITYAGQKCSISTYSLFRTGTLTFAVEVGTDRDMPSAPSVRHTVQGASIIVNPSADPEILTTDSKRKNQLEYISSANICGYIYCSAGYGESTQDMTYAGAASVWEKGHLLNESTRFNNMSSLTIADIDIERIENLRVKSNEFRTAATDSAAHADIVETGEPAATDFEEQLYRHVEAHPFVPSEDIEYRCSEILSIQTAGLMKRLSHIGCQTAVIGISGGLDSTLALLVTALAFDRLGWSHDRIVAVTMPGFGTTSRTKNDAWGLMKALEVTCREISIVPSCEQHFKDISHDPSVHDAVYENSQARERTQILMDIANQTNGIVIGTGDLSELALGWATYNGDHMSMYGVNAGIPKTLVQSLVRWVAENRYADVTSEGRRFRDILLDIVDTPISPELLPATESGEIKQVTEDLVGPYELHDFFIYHFIRNGFGAEKIFFLARKAFSRDIYDDETIMKWLKTFVRRFFSQQFKRSCLPDGPKVGSVGLSPRGDWNMPSDAWSTIWR
jgi:NAD+ synthase (glutamine-hydrolysing)